MADKQRSLVDREYSTKYLTPAELEIGVKGNSRTFPKKMSQEVRINLIVTQEEYMSRQLAQIKQLCMEIDEQGKTLNRLVEIKERELEAIRQELQRKENELEEREMELANVDKALEEALEKNRIYRERLEENGLLNEEVVVQNPQKGIRCVTCNELLIGSEIGKRYCNKCFRIWAMEHGKWRSGSWRSEEEKQKDRQREEGW